MYQCTHCDGRTFRVHRTEHHVVDIECEPDGSYRELRVRVENADDHYLVCSTCEHHVDFEDAEESYERATAGQPSPEQ